VPKEVVKRAKAVFDRRTTGEVAALVFDSLVDDEGTAGDHRMYFEHPLLQADLHLSASPAGTTITGRLHPTLAGRIEVEYEAGGSSIVESVVDGVLHLGLVPHGLIRLWLIDVPQRPAIRTDWFRI
jgi:hypothetical protein